MLTNKGKQQILESRWINTSSNSPLDYMGLSSTKPDISGLTGSTEPTAAEYKRVPTYIGGNDYSGNANSRIWAWTSASEKNSIWNDYRVFFEEAKSDYGWQKYLVLFTSNSLSNKNCYAYSPILVPDFIINGADNADKINFLYDANQEEYNFIIHSGDSNANNTVGKYEFTYTAATQKWNLVFTAGEEGTVPTFSGTTAQLREQWGIEIDNSVELTDGQKLVVNYGIHPVYNTIPIINKHGVRISIL